MVCRYSDRYKKRNHRNAVARKNRCFECNEPGHVAAACPTLGLADAKEEDPSLGGVFVDESHRLGVSDRAEQEALFEQEVKSKAAEAEAETKGAYELEREVRIRLALLRKL